MAIIRPPRPAPIRINPPARRRGTVYQRFAFQHPEFIEIIRSSKAAWKVATERLQRLTVREQRDATRQLLREGGKHPHLAFDALRRSGRLADATPAVIMELATQFNPFAPVHGEPVISRVIQKGSGRRTVQDFGPRRRMHQRAVADILRQLHPPPANQKLFNGGMPMALRAVATAYDCGRGQTHGVELDFVDFYGSITNVEVLAGLLRPLPRNVVEHVVWDHGIHDHEPNRVPAAVHDAHPTSGQPTGLSLGAATSPIVGERIISCLLAAAGLTETISYADNLFVLGHSDDEVSARIHHIRDSLASVPVGCLELRRSEEGPCYLRRARIDFLKQEGIATETGIVWQPGTQKVSQYQISVLPHLTLAHIAAAERRVKHWRRSYREWADGDALEDEYLAGLAVRRWYLTNSSIDRADARRAVSAACVAYAHLSASHFVPEEGEPPGQMRQTLIEEVDEMVDRAFRLRDTE